ncbi:MAG TPA: hypothetical protein VEU08_02640 [Vicinamibacterales bacterium]|nr:hypothetical protein [Vicinamibacterales bacterium]
MRRLLVAALVSVAASPAAASDVPSKRPGAPTAVVNVVHHKLKRGTSSAYQTLEANIVAAYERAKVPRVFWLTFQSTKDPRDLVYLNLANSTEEFQSLKDAWPGVAAAHPELPRLQERLAKLIETQASLLTTRRDDIEYGRTDVDFASMKALLLTTIHVKAGHEGRFVEAVRRASTGHAPWVLYEANDEPTFVLLAPLRSRAEAKRAAPVPRAVRALKGVFRDMDTRLYALAPAMSRLPADFAHSRSRPAAAAPHAAR